MEASSWKEPHTAGHVPQLRCSLIRAGAPSFSVPSYQLSKSCRWSQSQSPSRARPSPRKTFTISRPPLASEVLARRISSTLKMARRRVACRYVADDPERTRPQTRNRPTSDSEQRRGRNSLTGTRAAAVLRDKQKTQARGRTVRARLESSIPPLARPPHVPLVRGRCAHTPLSQIRRTIARRPSPFGGQWAKLAELTRSTWPT